jgi:hypothetical protein
MGHIANIGFEPELLDATGVPELYAEGSSYVVDDDMAHATLYIERIVAGVLVRIPVAVVHMPRSRWVRNVARLADRYLRSLKH